MVSGSSFFFDLDKNAVCYLIVDDRLVKRRLDADHRVDPTARRESLRRRVAIAGENLAEEADGARIKRVDNPAARRLAARRPSFSTCAPWMREATTSISKSRLALSTRRARRERGSACRYSRNRATSRVDTFDACAIALFHEILIASEGDPRRRRFASAVEARTAHAAVVDDEDADCILVEIEIDGKIRRCSPESSKVSLCVLPRRRLLHRLEPMCLLMAACLHGSTSCPASCLRTSTLDHVVRRREDRKRRLAHHFAFTAWNIRAGGREDAQSTSWRNG